MSRTISKSGARSPSSASVSAIGGVGHRDVGLARHRRRCVSVSRRASSSVSTRGRAAGSAARSSATRSKTSRTSSDSASVPSSVSSASSRSRRRRSASQIRQCSTAEPRSAAIGRSSSWCSSVKACGREGSARRRRGSASPSAERLPQRRAHAGLEDDRRRAESRGRARPRRRRCAGSGPGADAGAATRTVSGSGSEQSQSSPRRRTAASRRAAPPTRPRGCARRPCCRRG